ncbi:hypothetical protein C806_04665 [Lachnospiraceae bacterium 3-1]|nr:hypothetical protein C806_04665 [Lachnospiraceae bacterium 3-1]
MKKAWKKKKIIIPILFGIVLCIAAFCYVNDYYHSEECVQEYLAGNGTVSVIEIKDGLYLDGPGKDTAMIFYPGAKVEYTAYVPLLHKLANHGIDCFLIKMPCNLAFFGQNKAGKIMNSYDYDHWYLSGHSLGGAMAASYAAGRLDKLDGLALLAAYPTKTLASDAFSVVSIYGSEDGVLTMEKMEEGREFMPSDYTEVCIEGGNHALFGNYGSQDGDYDASITQEEQQNQTVAAILQMVENHKEEQQEEYDSGHIKNAVCLPHEDILSEPEILPDKGQQILVYCRSGNRSKQAAQKLVDMGYEKVLEFGGILDWPYQNMLE